MAKKKASESKGNTEFEAAFLKGLQERQAAGTDEPCSLIEVGRLVRPNVTDDELLSLVTSPVLRTKIIVAFTDDVNSPVTLKEDRERLAESSSVLQRTLHNHCSAEVPYATVAELKRQLTKPLQAAFQRHWNARLKNGCVPDFSSVVSIPGDKGRPKSVLQDRRFPTDEQRLSEQLRNAVATGSKTEAGPAPVEWSTVVAAADAVNTSSDLLKAARRCSPFADDTVTVRSDGEREWLVLKADAEHVLSSEVLVEQILKEVCSEASPELQLSVLRKQIPKAYRSLFTEIWRTHAELHRRFQCAELSLAPRHEVVFRDARYPRREAVLSEQLVTALEARKADDDGSYPCTFEQLLQTVGSAAGILVVNSAVRTDPYRSRVISGVPASANSPIALLDDAEHLARSPLLIAAALPSLLKHGHDAVAVETLCKSKVINNVVRPYLPAAIETLITERQLPDGIGALQISKKWHLFPLENIRT
ncbi:MAG: hypothetical protein KDA89_15940 [Planctomycetaceae bacterium]|nr:hypothetical protein [Planctomycetaceae bacterium]